jgi:hypothetical protein
MKYAGRDKVQYELLAFYHDRMACVVPALITCHQMGALGQDIDNLALALVTPLGSDYNRCRHFFSIPFPLCASLVPRA